MLEETTAKRSDQKKSKEVEQERRLQEKERWCGSRNRFAYIANHAVERASCRHHARNYPLFFFFVYIGASRQGIATTRTGTRNHEKKGHKKKEQRRWKKKKGEKKNIFVDNDFGRTSWSVDLAVATPSWANWTHGTFIYFAPKPL